jgi:hypothetical protein
MGKRPDRQVGEGVDMIGKENRLQPGEMVDDKNGGLSGKGIGTMQDDIGLRQIGEGLDG